MCVLVFSVVCLFVFEERERGRAGEVTAIDLFSGFDTSEAVSVTFSLTLNVLDGLTVTLWCLRGT